jgi:hypothetical protein
MEGCSQTIAIVSPEFIDNVVSGNWACKILFPNKNNNTTKLKNITARFIAKYPLTQMALLN